MAEYCPPYIFQGKLSKGLNQRQGELCLGHFIETFSFTSGCGTRKTLSAESPATGKIIKSAVLRSGHAGSLDLYQEPRQHFDSLPIPVTLHVINRYSQARSYTSGPYEGNMFFGTFMKFACPPAFFYTSLHSMVNFLFFIFGCSQLQAMMHLLVCFCLLLSC